jgi:hypothetical protein
MAVNPNATKTHEADPWVSIKDGLPPLNQPVLYRTKRYQAVGHFGSDGVWHFSAGRKESQPVLCWSILG